MISKPTRVENDGEAFNLICNLCGRVLFSKVAYPSDNINIAIPKAVRDSRMNVHKFACSSDDLIEPLR